MTEVAVRAEGISKRYLLHHDRAPYGRLSETLANLVRRPFRRESAPETEEFWALRDVSFEIPSGKAVGIIGRNGAGKSTLLKIMSRITSPTTGQVTLSGRVASLLEVGTGFHPELSGRENIYLSGAVLGMKRREIQRRFEEIVDFSGIESQFLDTQVKYYSSGMQVRLGFAVAAHLEPEILIIDEVLAVGDARFQAKCLGKIEEMGESGRTVIFVSHNMPSILRLCTRAILLDHGRVVADTSAHEAVRLYLDEDVPHSGERAWADASRAPGDDVARLKSIRVLPAGGGSPEAIDIREAIDIEVEHWAGEYGTLRPTANIALYNSEGVCLFLTNDWDGRSSEPPAPGTVVRSVCRIPGNFLAEGRVLVTAGITTFNPGINHALAREAVTFQVIDRTLGDGVRGDSFIDWPGVVRPVLSWRTSREP
ncbi:MAG TPA: ABC transporter ATP-binding protein [Candidatus Limnocylindria bacterium]|jgi:lipopolysaccharide transport system ATP-binding protein